MAKKKQTDAEAAYVRHLMTELDGRNVNNVMLAMTFDNNETIVTYKNVVCAIDDDAVFTLRDAGNKVVFSARLKAIGAFMFEIPDGDEIVEITHGQAYMQAWVDKLEARWKEERSKWAEKEQVRKMQVERMKEVTKRVDEFNKADDKRAAVRSWRTTSYIDKATGNVVDLNNLTDDDLICPTVDCGGTLASEPSSKWKAEGLYPTWGGYRCPKCHAAFQVSWQGKNDASVSRIEGGKGNIHFVPVDTKEHRPETTGETDTPVASCPAKGCWGALVTETEEQWKQANIYPGWGGYRCEDCHGAVDEQNILWIVMRSDGSMATCPTCGSPIAVKSKNHKGYRCASCNREVEGKDIIWKDIFDTYKPKMLGHSFDTGKNNNNVFGEGEYAGKTD